MPGYRTGSDLGDAGDDEKGRDARTAKASRGEYPCRRQIIAVATDSPRQGTHEESRTQPVRRLPLAYFLTEAVNPIRAARARSEIAKLTLGSSSIHLA